MVDPQDFPTARDGRRGRPPHTSDPRTPHNWVTRAVIGVAVVMAALLSAPRLRVDFEPVVSLPEVTVVLRLPEGSGSDPLQIARRWGAPIEGALRAAGGLIGASGEAGSDGFRMTARFSPGVAPEMKAARIAADLAALRRDLPADARLFAWVSQSGGRSDEVLALTGPDVATAGERVADELRQLPGARQVDVYGTRRPLISVRLHQPAASATAAAPIRDGIRDALSSRALGEWSDGRRISSVVALPDGRPVEDLDVVMGNALLPLGKAASIDRHLSERLSSSRLDGRPAVLIVIERDPDVSLLRFHAELKKLIDSERRGSRWKLQTIWSSGDLLMNFLRSLLFGVVAASTLLALWGFTRAGWKGTAVGLAVPLAVCCAILLFWTFSLAVDSLVLDAAAAALATSLPGMALRAGGRSDISARYLTIAAAFAWLLPIGVGIGTGQLAPFLKWPALAFALTTTAASAAALIVPVSSLKRRAGGASATTDFVSSGPPKSRGMVWRLAGGRLVRPLLRDAGGVLLIAFAVAYCLLSWFGETLDPRVARASGPRNRLELEMAFPPGTPLEESESVVTTVERSVRRLPGVTRSWSAIRPGQATVTLDLAPSLRRADRLQRFKLDLLQAIPLSPSQFAIVEPEERSGASSFSQEIGQRPSTDEDALFYRYILRGANLDELLQTYQRTVSALTRVAVSSQAIRREWRSSNIRLELTARPGTPPDRAAAMIMALREWTTQPVEIRERAGQSIRVYAAGAIRGNEVPQRADIFQRVVSIGQGSTTVSAGFDVAERRTLEALPRELGLFVLPVTVRVPGSSREEKLAKRIEIERALTRTSSGPGSAIDLPSLSPWQMSAGKRRLIGLAALLPLVLLAATTFTLDSLWFGLACLTPAVFGVAFIGPLLAIESIPVDETTLLIAGGALTAVTALGAAGASFWRNRYAAGVYRILRRDGGSIVAGWAAAILLLLVAVAAGDSSDQAWAAPLMVAAMVVISGGMAALILPAAISLAAAALRRRASPSERRLRRPPQWDSVQRPEVSVRSVSKTYATGFRALRNVSFDLTPGIVGLLGPNGAGKTTLLRILSGVLSPTRGQVRFRGVAVTPENLPAYRRFIGFLPQEFNAYPGLTAAEFLDFWMIERGISDRAARHAMIGPLLSRVGLVAEADRKVRDFSGGMRQRIGIARALIADPPLLIVDEPTTGLDVEARTRFRSLIGELAAERIIVLSTHIAGDIDAVAARVVLLDHGVLRYDGSPGELRSRAHGRVFETVASEIEARSLSRTFRVTTRVRISSGIRVRGVVRPGETLPGEPVVATLEEAYLAEMLLDDSADRREIRTFGFLGERMTSG